MVNSSNYRLLLAHLPKVIRIRGCKYFALAVHAPRGNDRVFRSSPATCPTCSIGMMGGEATKMQNNNAAQISEYLEDVCRHGRVHVDPHLGGAYLQ
jgi:hypothetical protein